MRLLLILAKWILSCCIGSPSIVTNIITLWPLTSGNAVNEHFDIIRLCKQSPNVCVWHLALADECLNNKWKCHSLPLSRQGLSHAARSQFKCQYRFMALMVAGGFFVRLLLALWLLWWLHTNSSGEDCRHNSQANSLKLCYVESSKQSTQRNVDSSALASAMRSVLQK